MSQNKKNNFNYDEVGTFIRESKNRFLCEVLINGLATECYIPSSCRLDNFLELTGKQVLLLKTKSVNARTKYSLIAVPYKYSYIILNTSLSNRAIYDSLSSRRFSFLGVRKTVFAERSIDGYKADLFIESTPGVIIEIKSLISLLSIATFPTVYSQRAINQLHELMRLSKSGYSICYFIVSLNPYVKEIQINPQLKEHNALLKDAQEHGIVLKAFCCEIISGTPSITKEIPINFIL